MSTLKISKKKLKAIVFTDIVNFTELSANDEQHALELIDKQREIVKPIVEKHSGEWLKEIGAGLWCAGRPKRASWARNPPKQGGDIWLGGGGGDISSGAVGRRRRVCAVWS